MLPTSPNFGFLAAHDPLLVTLAAQAEHYAADAPNVCLSQLRLFAEALAQRVAATVGAYASPKEPQWDLLDRLEGRGVLDKQTAALFHAIRKVGNQASHDPKFKSTPTEALHHLRFAWQLALWVHRTYRDPKFAPPAFVAPASPADRQKALARELTQAKQDLVAAQREVDAARAGAGAAQLAVAEVRLAAEQEALHRKQAEEAAARALEERALWEQLAEEAAQKLATGLAAIQAQAAAAPPQVVQATIANAQAAAKKIQLSEAETRALIDGQLRDAGWEADSVELTYAKGARPAKGRHCAIAEWPTAAGPADYALFVGLQLVAVVEAKRLHKDAAAAIEQSKRYSRGGQVHGDAAFAGGPWGDYRVPFLYATNGRPFLRQLLTKSGIHFLDARRPQNHPRALEAWHTPDGLLALLKQDVDTAQAKLAAEPTDYLGLRDYQVRAIHAVEAALAAGQERCLIAMATGTGKTRTFIGLIYRLIKAGRFRRVLFLVDRTSLGDQAAAAFRDARLENLQTFAEIFDVKALRDLHPAPETKLHFATAQAMIQRILGAADADVPPIDQYDCIVVDECHRGYTLDRELSDAELSFRDESDYISKYRRVLDHFDAVKIGLTATPALHTTQIFGDPVYQYSYREAVIDGWLVDQEPPIRIETQLARSGIHFDAGAHAKAYDPSKQVLDLVHLEDEVRFDVEDFNRRVINENFNRVVCEELANLIDPNLEGKTLVFCATDAHADMVVALLKQAFDARYGGVDDDAIVKITGTSDKPGQLIRRFRNEHSPSVAVTVDLLTTGIDIPAITNLVFLRRVRSRILYEQMKGRATRLCPEIHKTYFRVFDAVDIYDALEPVTAMRPVVAQPKLPFAQLVRELQSVTEAAAQQEILDQLVAKLQRKRGDLEARAAEPFAETAGMEPQALLHQLRTQSPAEAAQWFAQHPAVVDVLDGSRGAGDPVLLSEHEDRVHAIGRGYKDGQRPQDYLESFAAFIRGDLNAVPALLIVTQRPRDLSREQLKQLQLALGQAGYTDVSLQTAWREVTNHDIAASILGFVRQQALGEPLLPYGERVDRAVQRVLARHTWTDPQRKWLERIGAQLKEEKVVDRAALERGAFKTQGGGFARMNKLFDGRLEQVLGDLNEALWQTAS